MKASFATAFTKWIIILACGVLGGFLSAYAAVIGAAVTGLEQGGLGWQYLPFVFGGWFFGGLIALVAIAVSGIRKWSMPLRLVVALIVPPVATFIGGAISHPILDEAANADLQRQQELREATEAKYKALYEQLRHDPEIALREKWYELRPEIHHGISYQHRKAFRDSLRDPTVPYTLDLLKRFYAEAPVTRDVIFAHPACDAAFLSEHFEEAYERARSSGPDALAALVSNPNTSRELIERVATSKSLPGGAVEPARR